MLNMGHWRNVRTRVENINANEELREFSYGRPAEDDERCSSLSRMTWRIMEMISVHVRNTEAFSNPDLVAELGHPGIHVTCLS